MQRCVGKAVSLRLRAVTQKPLRRKMHHASLAGRAPVWQNGVAERPGHSHAHLAEASSSPWRAFWRAVDDERAVDSAPRAIPIHAPPGTTRIPDNRSLGMRGRPTRISGWPSRPAGPRGDGLILPRTMQGNPTLPETL